MKWATTQREVAGAVQIATDLEAGRRGVDESQDIAARILKALMERGMESFPALQEGYTRAEAVDTALTQIDDDVLRLEGVIVGPELAASAREEHERFRARKAEAQKRFQELPSSGEEVYARKKRLQAQADVVDKEAFKLGYEIHSMFALLKAVEKWTEDTRSQRKTTPEDEKAFAERLRQENETLSQQEKDLQDVRKALQDSRASVDTSLEGEGRIREEYANLWREEHALLADAERRLDTESARLLTRIHDVRGKTESLRARVGVAKEFMRNQVAKQGQLIRDKIVAEQQRLTGFGRDGSGLGERATWWGSLTASSACRGSSTASC